MAGPADVCCTTPPYRLAKSAPAQLFRVNYWIVATNSPDISASCGAQLPQSC